MQKKTLKMMRNKMISDIWDKEKAELEMEDISYIFNLSTSRIYKIIKKAESKNNN